MESDQVTTQEQQIEQVADPPVQEPTPVQSDPEDMTMQIQVLQDIHTELKLSNELDMWFLGALMMVIGGLCIIAFFVARGEHTG